jgi:hypothetical protein
MYNVPVWTVWITAVFLGFAAGVCGEILAPKHNRILRSLAIGAIGMACHYALLAFGVIRHD